MKLYSDSGRKSLFTLNQEVDKILVKEVGKEYLEYRRLWDLTSSGKVELDFPLQLDIELSTSCNLNCRMCPSNGDSTFQKIEFSLFKKIIDEGVEHGIKAVSLNYVNEPLLRKDIAKFVAYARQCGVIDVFFNSNGILLNEKVIKALIQAGLTKLSISLDATKESTYRKLRPGGDFKTVIKNVHRFLEIRKNLNSKLPLLKITFLKTSENIHELDEFISLWKNEADLVSIQSMSNPFDGEKRAEIDEELLLKNEKKEINSDFRCPSPFQRMAVRHDGTILACCHFRGEKLIIGNVTKLGLYGTYNGEEAKKIRARLKAGEFHKLPVCRECADTTFK